MRADKMKQGINENYGQDQQDKQNSRKNINMQSLSEQKYENQQYNTNSNKPISSITLQRITDNKIEQINRKQQELFENDINIKLQNIMNSSRTDQRQQNTSAVLHSFNLQNKNVKHSKLDLSNKLNASVDQVNSQDALMGNIDEHEQQQQLIHAPHPQPNNMSNITQIQNNTRVGNHQRIAISGAGHIIQVSHSHHQSLSETRSLKSFKSLQDQRLQRQLNRKNETSNQGSNGSQTRQTSNVREMLQTQQEKLLFESKFKGSLDKLDDFERQWSDFKVNQPPSNSQSQSRIYNENDMKQRQESLNRLKQNTENLISTQKIVTNYQTQIQNNPKDMRIKSGTDLRNQQLDQINESPRESILQSPSSNTHNEKIRNLYQQPKTAFASVQRQPQLSSEKQQKDLKDCKTLKIDLNEERSALESRQHNNLIKSVTNNKSDDKQIEIKKVDKVQQKVSQNPVKKSNLQLQQTQQVNSNIMQQTKQIELGRNQGSNKQTTNNPVISQTLSQFQAKDDLVERVIESIKVLNQKEEEVKQTKQTPQQQQKPKLTSKEQHVQESTAQLQTNQMRRRTNTLTTGERPNLLQPKPQTNQQSKDNNQPFHQQIAQLKKQVSQSNHNSKDFKIQPSSTTHQQTTNQGFIGNSFVKIAQEKLMQQQHQSNQLNSKITEKSDKQQQDLNNDPYQYNLQLKHAKSNNQPTTNQQTKTPGLSAASKEKVEQLRKAFTSNKEVQSRSTKNLISAPTQQQVQQQPNVILIPPKQNQNNFLKQSMSNNSSQITTPVGSITQKQSQITTQPIKSEKLTKRADISLVNEITPLSSNVSLNMGNVSQNTSLQITSGTPNKSSITNLKKSTQITPQNKLSGTSPQTQHQQNSNTTSQQNSTTTLPTMMQNNLHSKRNSQQTSAFLTQHNSNNIMQTNTTAIANTTKNVQKGKNRRQPTQTQFDSASVSSTNMIKNDQAKQNQIVKKQFALVERVEGQKLDKDSTNKKPRTLLDDYFHGSSPDTLKLPQNNQKSNNNKSSQNNSKHISISKHRDISKAQIELDQELAEIEKEFLEDRQKKQVNFKAIQEPSINWNASPEKQRQQIMPEKKLFEDKEQQLIRNDRGPLESYSDVRQSIEAKHSIQLQEQQNSQTKQQYSHRDREERLIKPIQSNKVSLYDYSQDQLISSRSDQYTYNSSRPLTSMQQQQQHSSPNQFKQIQQDEPIHNQQVSLNKQQVQNKHQFRKESDNSDESNQNHIEKRLNKLMEETRRRLQNQGYDDDDYDQSSIDQSPLNPQIQQNFQDDINVKDFNHQQITEALGRIEEQNNAMNRMRNKAQTPQLNSQVHYTGGNHPQIQYQMNAPQQYPPQQQQYAQQPFIYGQQYPSGYPPQIIYPQGNLQQNPPMITIINPAMQYQQHHPYTMFGNQYLPNQSQIQPTQHQHSPSQDQTLSGSANNDMTVSGNSPTIIPGQQQQRTLKVAQNNASVIIGTDSQFFYPQNNNVSQEEQKLQNNVEDDDAIYLPPKQLSQVVIPQNQLLYQQQIYNPLHQQQLQQQQFYILGYPPTNYIPPQNYIPPHMRQASDSFQQQQIMINNSVSGYNTNSYENQQFSARGSPSTNHQQNSADKKNRIDNNNTQARDAHQEEL